MCKAEASFGGWGYFGWGLVGHSLSRAPTTTFKSLGRTVPKPVEASKSMSVGHQYPFPTNVRLMHSLLLFLHLNTWIIRPRV